jgi:organic radical activating enzyme
MHLRIENDGEGLLIVNASTVLHLNQSAAEYAYYLVKNLPDQEAAQQMAKRYQVDQAQALEDYLDFKERIDALIATPDLDPILFLGFDRAEPYAGQLAAPYRIDCALTYHAPDEAPEGFAPVDRVKRELRMEEWQQILKKAWDAGIPHVIFTGGEPTLRPDLDDLIAYAEELGMVTGLITSGYRLVETDYLHKLLLSGLDHIMLVLNTEEEIGWEALRDLMPEDIHTTVHLTINQDNKNRIDELLERLNNIGVHSLSLSAHDLDLKEALDAAREKAAQLEFTPVWDLPVPYSTLNPVNLELESAGIPVEGAGQAWVYVEPDGDVIAAQGSPDVMGNLLTQPWDQIWKPRQTA